MGSKIHVCCALYFRLFSEAQITTCFVMTWPPAFLRSDSPRIFSPHYMDQPSSLPLIWTVLTLSRPLRDSTGSRHFARRNRRITSTVALLCPSSPYSHRNAFMGSTDEALRAGNQQARRQTASSNAEPPSKISGPCALAATQRVSTRLIPKRSAQPAATPAPTLTAAEASTIVRTSERCAPRAMRIPNSLAR
jgi:hypothetical protein